MNKIYFDACCYNRPFDNLAQEKIRLETEAILLILNSVEQNQYKLFKSPALDFEIGKMKDFSKKAQVLSFYNSSCSLGLIYVDEINDRANILGQFNIKYMDALHIAFCEYYKIDYLLTTDKILLNAVNRSDVTIKVFNPITFIMEVF